MSVTAIAATKVTNGLRLIKGSVIKQIGSRMTGNWKAE
jgi:hypothetical protein